MKTEEYAFAWKLNGTDLSGIVTLTNPPQLICYCDEEQSKIILEALNKSLPPADGAEDDLTTIRKIFDRNGFDFDAFEYENEYSSENLIASMREFAAIKQQHPTADKMVEIVDDFEKYKYHSLCARATLFPGKTLQEVEALIEQTRIKGGE